MLNWLLFRCEEKMLLTTKSAGFDSLILVFLVVWSELRVRCVLGFVRFVKILEDQWKW